MCSAGLQNVDYTERLVTSIGRRWSLNFLRSESRAGAERRATEPGPGGLADSMAPLPRDLPCPILAPGLGRRIDRIRL
jgi:hypothetical protein